MAMAVLRPQDCLSSPHSRQYNYSASAVAGVAQRPTSSPRSGIGSQGPLLMRYKTSPFSGNRLIGPLMGAETQINRSGNGILDQRINSAGLLPAPYPGSLQPHLARSSSFNLLSGSAHNSTAPKVPFSSSLSSSPARNLIRKLPHTRSYSATKVPLSPSLPSSSSPSPPSRNAVQTPSSRNWSRRSVSAGLPVNSRTPPKPVRGNGSSKHSSSPFTGATSVNSTDIRALEVASKFVDKKTSFRKHQGLNGSDHIGDICKRTRPDASFTLAGAAESSRYSSNVLHDEGKISGRRSLREGDLSKGQRSSGLRGNSKELGRSSVVTILKRPKDKDAAEVLIANFLQRTDSSSDDYSDREIEDCINAECTAENFRMDMDGAAIGFNDTVSFDTKGRDKSTSCTVTNMVHMVTSPLNSSDSGKDVTIAVDCFPALTDIERWAGPAFYNSPPPSSLPLPSFSLKQARSCSLDLSGFIAQQHSFQAFDKEESSSSSSSSPSPLVCRLTHNGMWDTASATQDLRRILNLDLCSL